MVSSTTDSIIAFNTGMTTAKSFGTPEGTQVSSIAATPLFPFTSPDSFYAGACTTNDPGTGAAKASVNVPANGSTTASVQLPAFYLTVKNGSSAINGATVGIYRHQCENGGNSVKRTYTTNSSGRLADPGLPWSTYDVCASAVVSSSTRYDRHEPGGPQHQRHDPGHVNHLQRHDNQTVRMSGLDLKDERGTTLIELVVATAAGVLVIFGV